ncbi:hypothetical protein H5410_039321, partial [Solanum commersonii]
SDDHGVSMTQNLSINSPLGGVIAFAVLKKMRDHKRTEKMETEIADLQEHRKKIAKLETEVADLKDYKRSVGITMDFHKWRHSFSQYNGVGVAYIFPKEPKNVAWKCNAVVDLVKETSSNRGWRLLL